MLSCTTERGFVMQVLAAFDWGGRLLTAIGHALDVLLSFVPALIGAIVLIIIGWIVSAIVAGLVLRILRAVHFDRLTQHAGIDALSERFGLPANGNVLLAGLAKWFIRLIFLVAAFNALQVPAISTILDAIVLWLPSLVVALVIVILGAALARVAGNALTDGLSGMGISGARLLGSLVQYAIVAFVLIIALEQIGVGVPIVTTLFGAVMLALALSFGLAFGLGGRDTAKRIVDSWYTNVSQATPVVPSVGSGTANTALPPPPPNQKTGGTASSTSLPRPTRTTTPPTEP